VVAGAMAREELTDAAARAALAASAAWLHGRAGVLAAAVSGDGPITALDVAEALPRAVAEVLRR
ncbi:NAD(P)H-hydrate dehydratase, partial [Microbacterium arthrosphaerae]